MSSEHTTSIGSVGGSADYVTAPPHSTFDNPPLSAAQPPPLSAIIESLSMSSAAQLSPLLSMSAVTQLPSTSAAALSPPTPSDTAQLVVPVPLCLPAPVQPPLLPTTLTTPETVADQTSGTHAVSASNHEDNLTYMDITNEANGKLHADVSVCVECWQHAGPEARKKMLALFAVTGIFVCLCRHGHLLGICDMV